MTSSVDNAASGGGGFMPSAAPPPSSPTPSTPSASFPRQRDHPLRSGSIKEADVINHIDSSILAINRRHAKKFSSTYDSEDQDQGYDSFKQAARDVGALVDFIWVTGTRMPLLFLIFHSQVDMIP